MSRNTRLLKQCRLRRQFPLLLAAYRAGVSMRSLAKAFKVSPSMISKWMRQAGHQPRPGGVMRRYTDEQRRARDLAAKRRYAHKVRGVPKCRCRECADCKRRAMAARVRSAELARNAYRRKNEVPQDRWRVAEAERVRAEWEKR